MKRFSSLPCRLPRVTLPGALLLAMLQRVPALRVATLVEQALVSSPAGAILRSGIGAVAALGAIHTLAGATEFLLSPNRNPVVGTVGTAISPVVFTVTGAAAQPGSFRISGTLPPGLMLLGVNNVGILNASSGFITGAPTAAGSFTISIEAFLTTGAQGDMFPPDAFSLVFNISGPAVVAPTITANPVSQTVNSGGTTTFTVIAANANDATFQWRKNNAPLVNGGNVSGAGSASLTLGNVQVADAGSYSVVVTNSAGSATSGGAGLTVITGVAPIFTSQPLAQTIAVGSTVVLAAMAAGTPVPTFQWQFNNVNIVGATNASLVLSGAAVLAGDYRLIATNSGGSTTSNPARLELSSTTDFGRLQNLSVRTNVTAADPFFTMGAVIGGGAPTSTKPLLIRAAGPSLAIFGVGDALADSRLDVFAGQFLVLTNDNWGGGPALMTIFGQTGAFAFIGPDSKDAAVFNPAFTQRDYTVQVSSAVLGAAGTVIAEVYDASSNNGFTASSARLVNMSVRKQIEPNGSITAGFVIGGQTARTVLIGGVGPSLALFGVTDFMADPRLTLFNHDQAVIAENDNWNGDAQLTATGKAVNAFAINDTTGRNAIILMTLPPGDYTAKLSGVNGIGGNALVEVYEVP